MNQGALLAVAVGFALLAACGKRAPTEEDAGARGEASSPEASVARPPWPNDAPPASTCESHEDCGIVVWDGPQPPDPCCHARVGYMAMSRAFLSFMEDYRKRSCSGVTCPPAPFPGAEPACCAGIPRCVARRCVTACEDATASDVPKVSVLDAQCSGYRSRPVVATEPCLHDGGALPKEYAGGASSPGYTRLTACCASLRSNIATLEYGAPFEMKEWVGLCDDTASRIAGGCTPTKLSELRQKLRGKGVPGCQP